MANAQTRQVGVYVRMKNPGGIVGGQFATGRIIGQATKEATVIPEAAVRGAGSDTHVLVIQNGRVAKRPISVGGADPSTGMVAVSAGLQPGEMVIVASTIIEAGARVQIGSSAPPATPPQGKE
jgi:multidrug efflux pump subunit AcrA (membrane-fusion protein)